tara:strand:- start:32584 stop:32820 length:237 start_codon:yes stop_codon:yes gene_type:complete
MGGTKRTVEDIQASISAALERLKDVQERGDEAISEWDLRNGYDADFYLNRVPILANHVAYHERELQEANKNGVQKSLF